MSREEPGPGIVDRLWSIRDRILASQAFQRWAAAFPLTRPIALRRSRQVFDLVAGFVYSQTVLAAVRLGLPRFLEGRARTVEEVAAFTGLGRDATRRLLSAGTSLHLFRRARDGRFGLGRLGAPLVGNQALAAMLEHNVLFYRDLEDPVALLRRGAMGGTHLARYWPYARSRDPSALDPGAVAEYSELMAASQPLVAREILDAYPFHRHRRALDVGGGEGAFLQALAEREPGLELTLFDLPAVARRARDRFDAAGMNGRVRVVGGDFLHDPLPPGADLITLVRVLHDQDDHQALSLLRAARRALAPGGALLVGEPMAGVRGAETVGGAYFPLYLLAMGQGQPRTPGEIEELLKRAGFRRVRLPRARAPVLCAVAVAHP
jgi:demethylspheroidene O-methyltransferase